MSYVKQYPVKVANACVTCRFWKNAEKISHKLKKCRRIRKHVTELFICERYEEDEMKKRNYKRGRLTALTKAGVEY